MKLLALGLSHTIEPPFKNDIEELVVWISPISVGVIGKGLHVGGMLISPNVVVTTQHMDEDEPEMMVQGTRQKAKKLKYTNPDFWFTYYQIPVPVVWVGLPQRKTVGDEFLFAYSPLPEVFCFEPIACHKSKAVSHFERSGQLKVDYKQVAFTLPVVDRFGYFVGLGIGECRGEGIVQPFCMKNTKM